MRVRCERCNELVHMNGIKIDFKDDDMTVVCKDCYKGDEE